MATIVAITQAEATIAVIGTPGAGYGRVGVNSANSHLVFVDSAGNVTDLIGVPGATSVVAAAVIADNAVVRGDGGGYGVQDSGVLISDADVVSGVTGLTMTGTIATPTLLTMGGNIDLDGNQLIIGAAGNEWLVTGGAGVINVVIATAVDFVFGANTFYPAVGSNIWLNAQELRFDTDQDTKITVVADDHLQWELATASGQLDININGADDFHFIANDFRCLSGSQVSMREGTLLHWYDVGSSHSVSLQAPALTANSALTWPAAIVADGYLQVAAGGALSWSTPSGGGTRRMWVGPQYETGNAIGEYVTGTVTAANHPHYNFYVPAEASSVDAVYVVFICTQNDTDADVDLDSDYGADGEAYNNHSEAAGVAWSVTQNQIGVEDIIGDVFNALAPGDYAGLDIDEGVGGIFGSMLVIGLVIEYTI